MTREEIKQARKSLGLSQPELAARMDLSVDTVRDWEGGRRKLKGPSLILFKLLVARKV